ncbi:MAG: hypothetical protein AB1758_18160 [Candidatus Eremiobacterota bacterium]
MHYLPAELAPRVVNGGPRPGRVLALPGVLLAVGGASALLGGPVLLSALALAGSSSLSAWYTRDLLWHR